MIATKRLRLLRSNKADLQHTHTRARAGPMKSKAQKLIQTNELDTDQIGKIYRTRAHSK